MADHLYHRADVECFGHAHPVAAVGPDGSTSFWLLDIDHQHTGPECCRQPTPDHEQLGPLPDAVVDRLGRCNAPTWHAAPCRNRAGPGGRCHHHRGR